MAEWYRYSLGNTLTVQTESSTQHSLPKKAFKRGKRVPEMTLLSILREIVLQTPQPVFLTILASSSRCIHLYSWRFFCCHFLFYNTSSNTATTTVSLATRQPLYIYKCIYTYISSFHFMLHALSFSFSTVKGFSCCNCHCPPNFPMIRLGVVWPLRQRQ